MPYPRTSDLESALGEISERPMPRVPQNHLIIVNLRNEIRAQEYHNEVLESKIKKLTNRLIEAEGNTKYFSEEYYAMLEYNEAMEFVLHEKNKELNEMMDKIASIEEELHLYKKLHEDQIRTISPVINDEEAILIARETEELFKTPAPPALGAGIGVFQDTYTLTDNDLMHAESLEGSTHLPSWEV
ncbi:hypothetical protein PCE1_000670 [Barthelona sp. PCE]